MPIQQQQRRETRERPDPHMVRCKELALDAAEEMGKQARTQEEPGVRIGRMMDVMHKLLATMQFEKEETIAVFNAYFKAKVGYRLAQLIGQVAQGG